MSLAFHCYIAYIDNVKKFTLQVIYIIMATFVINVAGLTLNKEAVADILFGEQDSIAAEAGHAYGEASKPQLPKTKAPCNHYCHFPSHFMGMFSNVSFTAPEVANVQVTAVPVIIAHSSPDSLFRPPRRFS